MPKRTTAVLLTLAVCGAGLGLTDPAAWAGPPRSAIAGSQPAWAGPANRRGDANPAQTIQLRVYLTPRDRAGAEATARALSDPTSPRYHHYLTAADVSARFAPTTAAVDEVRSWLRGSGLQPGTVPPNRRYVEATGPIASVQRAFGVRLSVYEVRGRRLRAAEQALSVPSSLAGTVAGVVGVDQSLTLLRPDHIGPDDRPPSNGPSGPGTVPPGRGFRNARPCGEWFGQQTDTTSPPFGPGPRALPVAPCGYLPPQLRSAYGTNLAVAAGFDGRGTTVAIVDAFASPTVFTDASTYARRNDPGHPLAPDQLRQVVFPANPALEGPAGCDAAGWYGEETLDVEAVHAMAPGARIVYVGGSDCQDVSLDKALNEVVARNLAQIVTNSYGNQGEDVPADQVAIFDDIAVEAALKGIGVYFSSGDNGDEAAHLNGVPSTDFAASSPWVTAVGGTSLAIDSTGHRQFETGWETDKSTLVAGHWTPAAPGEFAYGSGGGTSRLFIQPFYQRGVVPDRLAAHNQAPGRRGRVVPDISMVGDPNTGMRIGITQTFPDGAHYNEYRIGGTSMSSPLFAGVVALADQVSRQRHGFVNPALYRGRGRAAITDVNHVGGAEIRVDYANGLDAKAGMVTTVRTFDAPGLTIATTPGYDDVTGLGTPDGLAFLLRL